MTLSEEQIIDLFNEACRETFNGLERFRHFARAIEAEVRAQDDALIRQLVEALDNSSDMVFKDPAKAVLREAAITAARARLERKS